ncbi:MAG: hypothetical protein AMS18_00605 [Gemmatimonas sp. SG8_17]|nr:MAG: hypothetical protein AMS18_00605 [Gemmatimonas sp. SG8_17]
MFNTQQLRRALALVALAAPALLAEASAQHVRYSSVSTVELGGSFGRVMQLVPGFGDPVRETMSITSTHMRTDEPDHSSIMNAEDGTITYLDHEAKTYWTMNFAEMLAGLTGGMVNPAGQAAEPAAQEEAATQGDSVHYEVHVSTDRTGRTERVAGYEAEQVFLTVEIKGEARSEAGDSTIEGSLYTLSELWLSEEFPGHEAEQAFQQAWAEQVMQGFDVPQESARDMEAVYAQDPRLREGIEQMAEQLKELRGTALKTVAHFVVVPEGVEFDREAVLRDADRSLGEDVGAAAARGAVAGARRRLGGLLGGRNRDEEDEPELKQAVVMRVKTEVLDVDLAALPPDLFQPPGDYTERQPQLNPQGE